MTSGHILNLLLVDSEYTLLSFCIFSYRVHIVSSAPKMSIAILVFEIRVSLKYHQGTFSF